MRCARYVTRVDGRGEIVRGPGEEIGRKEITWRLKIV
jgi:hypothetical protein